LAFGAVFAVDVLQCPDCHGPMRILAAIHPPEATWAILEHLGLPSRAPPIAAARTEEEFPSNEFGPEYAGSDGLITNVLSHPGQT